MKYCEDCKFCIKYNSVGCMEYICRNEDAFYHGENFVSRSNMLSCNHARQWGPCGIDGKLWEAKDAI
jgi:hypothetical protein